MKRYSGNSNISPHNRLHKPYPFGLKRYIQTNIYNIYNDSNVHKWLHIHLTEQWTFETFLIIIHIVYYDRAHRFWKRSNLVLKYHTFLRYPEIDRIKKHLHLFFTKLMYWRIIMPVFLQRSSFYIHNRQERIQSLKMVVETLDKNQYSYFYILKPFLSKTKKNLLSFLWYDTKLQGF